MNHIDTPFGSTEQSKNDTQDAFAKLEHMQRDAKATISSVRDKGRDVVQRVKSEVEERPYVGMGVCAGLGFALGALFGSKALRLGIIVGVGFLASRIPFGEIGQSLRDRIDDLRGEQSKSRKRNVGSSSTK